MRNVVMRMEVGATQMSPFDRRTVDFNVDGITATQTSSNKQSQVSEGLVERGGEARQRADKF